MFATVQVMGGNKFSSAVVVFGVGETREAAEVEARAEGVGDDGLTVLCTPEQAAEIRDGRVEFHTTSDGTAAGIRLA